MSIRSETAQKLADWINEYRFNSPFGGEVNQSETKRYYSVLFSYPRYLDGLVRVYSPKFILIETQGPWGNYRKVFESLDNALAFMQAAFVDHNSDKAEAVPVKKNE